jgi:hypothetical protein
VDFISEVFHINNEYAFNSLCLKVFHFQYQHNPVYQNFVNHLFQRKKIKFDNITHYTQIPFLPIDFFKYHQILSVNQKPELFFESSGTTQSVKSRHFIYDISIYQKSILSSFTKFYGHPENYLFIFLLPNEKERPHSSLIYMAKYLQSFSKYHESGFYLNDLRTVKDIISNYQNTNTKIFILGLSYALIDFSEYKLSLNDNNIIVMETGGMKGKREEMPKKFFHNYLKNKLGLSKIHSEYGMTELLSQAYSQENGIFETPPWMKILVRDTDDPFAIFTQNKQGIVNVIDLANVYSCSFIATSDVGRIYDNGKFEILGRSDFSDLKGCNLMYS